MSKAQCILCKFHQERQNDSLVECRRFPQQNYFASDGFRFPLRKPTDWCGEFKFGPSMGLVHEEWKE